METVGALVGTSGTLFLLIGLIMFLPMPSLKPKRWLAKWLALAGVGLFIVGIILTPAQPTQNRASVDQPGSRVAPRANPELLKSDAIAFYRSVFEQMRPCDAAGKKSAETSELLGKGRATIYDAFNAAVEQEKGCRQAMKQLRSVTIPASFSGEVRLRATKAVEICTNVAFIKQEGAVTLQKVFDGDAKPSMMKRLADQSETAQIGVLACAEANIMVTSAAGIEIADMAKLAPSLQPATLPLSTTAERQGSTSRRIDRPSVTVSPGIDPDEAAADVVTDAVNARRAQDAPQ